MKEKKNPKISIIIPMYGVEKYLNRCLDSVLNQTFTDWQAICVNDGSPDKSSEIAHEYAARDSRFIVVDKENSGVSETRNVGMQYATGDYILYLDSDDFIHPQTMEITYDIAQQKNADMVIFDYDKSLHNALKKKLRKGIDISRYVPDNINVMYNKFHGKSVKNVIFHATERNRSWRVKRPVRRHCYPVLALYRAKLIKQISFIKGIIIEDFPWWISVLAMRPNTVFVKLPLYFYIPNGGSILNSSKAMFMVKSIAHGLKYSYGVSRTNFSPAEFRHFNREFLWPFIITMVRKLREITDADDIADAKRFVSDLYACGVCDLPCNRRAKKYKRRIEEFIK